MHVKYDANPLLILNDELQRRIYDFVIKDEFEDAEKIRDEYFPGYSLEELFEHKQHAKQ